MASMGFLLADWSLELIRSRKRKGKAKQSKSSTTQQAEEAAPCPECAALACKLSTQAEIVAGQREERECLTILVAGGDSEAEDDLVTHVAKVMKEAETRKEEVAVLKAEILSMAESIGRQLTDRDTTHAEIVKEMEAIRLQKEKQLFESSSLLRQQLAAARKEVRQLQGQLGSDSSGPGEQSVAEEMKGLKKELDMRRMEVEQLKAEKNSLVLEMERCTKLEAEQRKQKQKTEELAGVIRLKNDQLVQVLDKYENLQEELEIEVCAHLACMKELERSREETQRLDRGRGVFSMGEKGRILDVVNKDKGLVYRYNQ